MISHYDVIGRMPITFVNTYLVVDDYGDLINMCMINEDWNKTIDRAHYFIGEWSFHFTVAQAIQSNDVATVQGLL